jgi:hypothetical protein
MSEAFRVVVRWIATILIGAATGGAASQLGAGTAATLVGAVLLLGSGVFVGATIWATYIPIVAHPGRPPEPGEMEEQTDLRGPGLFRSVSLGFFGAGLCVGGLTAVGGYLAIAAAAGVIALLLTLEPRGSSKR